MGLMMIGEGGLGGAREEAGKRKGRVDLIPYHLDRGAPETRAAALMLRWKHRCKRAGDE